MKYYHFYQILLILICARYAGNAQINAYEFIPGDSVRIKASDSYSSSCKPDNLINGSGLSGITHDNDMSAYTMWHSSGRPTSSQAFPSTRTGSVWISASFESAEEIKELWIWNHNQPDYTSRGLRKIYIEFSLDGISWNTLSDKDSSYWIIPEASGKNGIQPSLIVDFRGYRVKYVVITADREEGNYGDDYFGLSEIRFIKNEKQEIQDLLSLKGTDIIENRNGSACRKCRLVLDNGIGYGSDTITFRAAGNTVTIGINATEEAFHNVEIYLPFYGDFTQEQRVSVEIHSTGDNPEFLLDPPRKWEIHLLPQSHVDIGYTHTQDEVKELHHKFIEYAIHLAEKTKDFPEGAQFVWNTEVLWAVKSYLKEKKPAEKEQLVRAIRKGWINLDATFVHINTSLANTEQLYRLFHFAEKLERDIGIQINTAQQVDIPGMSWGIVAPMVQSGVNYMLNMPNIVEDESLENYPFYWVSPSGKEKILHFETYYYNLGYHLKGRYIPNYLTGNSKPYHAENPEDLFLNPFIFNFLEQLKGKGYSYGIIPLAWIMTDNSPPDPDLPYVVRSWNSKYSNPKVTISTTRKFFQRFEESYGDVLPQLTGDYTEYWTDGVASGASETSMNRNNSERILQMETLYSMFRPEEYDPELFTEIWDNILLFTEHTWGSHLSISKPDDPEVISQWEKKSGFAKTADRVLDSLEAAFQTGDGITVVNTQSWERSEIALIPEHLSRQGNLVINKEGDTIVSQRLTTGELAIYAEGIPAFGTRSFLVLPGAAHVSEGFHGNNCEIISNGYYSLSETDGTKLIIKDKKGNILLDPVFSKNDSLYRYVSHSGSIQDTSYATLTSINKLESGPLLASYQLSYDAPGFQEFSVEVRLRYMEDYIEIINRANKLEVRSKERGSLNFPLVADNARIAYEIPGGVVNRETDILPGSNHSYLTIQRFLELRDDHHGYVFVSLDAPIMRVQRSTQKTTLESVLIDNYWHVNFRASQQGPLCFRYYIRSQEERDLIAAGKLGLEVYQPLMVLSSQKIRREFPLLGIASESIIATACRPAGTEEEYEVRLFNLSPSPAGGTILVKQGSRIFTGKPAEKNSIEISNGVLLEPFEIKTVIIKGP